MVKIKLLMDKEIIQETINRIGIANIKLKILYPSCYIYDDGNDVYIAHFKELFALKNGYNGMNALDIKRTNAIAFCLKQWNMIDIDINDIKPYDIRVFVLPYNQKSNWKISHKVNIFKLK